MNANLLVYVSYGTGPHVDEARYSILSALADDGDRPAAYDVLVVGDDPAPFADLGVAFDRVDADRWRQWAGPAGFTLRVKAEALRHALARPGCSTAVMVDGDTYFRRSPAALFGRVAPGRTLMHVREGGVGRLVGMGFDRVKLPGTSYDLGTADGPYRLAADTPMWNSGVVGLAAADAGLLAEVLALTDAIHAAVGSRLAEQVAYGCVLGRRTRLAECRDVVFHYHPAFLRNRFRTVLARRLAETADLTPAARGRALRGDRPVPPTGKRLRAIVKRRLKPFGLFAHDLESSV